MATNPPLYTQLADEFAEAIRCGVWQAGQSLPTVRWLAAERQLDVNTVNRAYQELARRGLVVAQGRRGTLVRDLRAPAVAAQTGVGLSVMGSCSHDFGLHLLTRHLQQVGVTLAVQTSNSEAGLHALACGQVQLAGCHLLDADGQGYNHDAIARWLPGRRLRLITLAERTQGLIVRQGNPLAIQGIADLARPGLRLANRQAGSGTRSLLDRLLASHGLAGANLSGYERALPTHLAVAAAIAGGSADVGLGLATAAQALELGFVPLVRERYDLVLPEVALAEAWFGPLIETLAAPQFQRAIESLAGYDATHTAWMRSVVG